MICDATRALNSIAQTVRQFERYTCRWRWFDMHTKYCILETTISIDIESVRWMCSRPQCAINTNFSCLTVKEVRTLSNWAIRLQPFFFLLLFYIIFPHKRFRITFLCHIWHRCRCHQPRVCLYTSPSSITPNAIMSRLDNKTNVPVLCTHNQLSYFVSNWKMIVCWLLAIETVPAAGMCWIADNNLFKQ